MPTNQNKDLEIIKNYSLNPKVRAAAERMAAEIEELKAKIELMK